MPVISNTSPLLNLAIIDHLFLLPQQFEQIYIPSAVVTELKINEDLPGSRALQAAINEGWLIPQTVKNTALVSLLRRDLHQGESEAIALAVELSADKILLDEKEARQAARALGLNITGILGILLRGWHEGTITSIKAVTERLQQDANFRIAPALLAQILQESDEREESP
jgi:predicted nucleic acid-binding protein